MPTLHEGQPDVVLLQLEWYKQSNKIKLSTEN